MSEPVLLEIDGQVATLTINRPQTLNALDVATIEAFHAALDRIEGDAALRVLIVTGAGRAFVAGGDIADLASRRGLAHYQEFAEDIHALFRRIETLDKPTIAAVNGFALGGGTELLLALDIRLVSDRARLGLPEITLGLFPGAGGSQRLIRQVPLCRAKEMMFTGRMLSAEEAVSIGLANRVVPHDALMAEARALAREIARKSPLVLKLLKRTLVAGADMPLSAALRHEQAMIGLVLDSEDAHEGCAAFLEKRTATFRGT
jgi:enoyl-CoA hydratase